MTPSEKCAHFLQKSVVQAKVVQVAYLKEQGMGMFLNKLEAQGWLGLFINTHRACFLPDLVQFYANYVVTKGVVISTINRHDLRFKAKDLGEILGMAIEGFDVYVREDKIVFGAKHLVELIQKLSQQSTLTAP